MKPLKRWALVAVLGVAAGLILQALVLPRVIAMHKRSAHGFTFVLRGGRGR